MNEPDNAVREVVNLHPRDFEEMMYDGGPRPIQAGEARTCFLIDKETDRTTTVVCSIPAIIPSR